MDASWEVDDEGKRAVLAINGPFQTNEIEKLIADMLLLRSGMLPPVPYEPPRPDSEADQAVNVTVQAEPRIALELTHRNGKIRMWLRHEGAGWMIYELPVATACGMRDYLVANTPQAGEGTEFFTLKLGDVGKPH